MAVAWRVQASTGGRLRWLGAVVSFAFAAEPQRAAEPAGTAHVHDHARDEAREQVSFDTLFARHEPEVFGYLWRITGDRHLASDLCQETFLRAWQRFDTIREYEQPVGWLLRVATNLALNALRRRHTRVGMPVVLDDTNDPAASDPAWRMAEHDVVHRTLLALPEKMRTALVLREVYGLSFVEVAQALSISQVAARMTLSRARERFREQYRREEGRS